MIEVYFWRKVKYLAGKKPSHSDFSNDYVKVIEYPDKWKSGNLNQLDNIYLHLNSTSSPLTKKQKWLRKNLTPQPHTSMAPGDIIKHENAYWLCLHIGWERLHFYHDFKDFLEKSSIKT